MPKLFISKIIGLQLLRNRVKIQQKPIRKLNRKIREVQQVRECLKHQLELQKPLNRNKAKVFSLKEKKTQIPNV